MTPSAAKRCEPPPALTDAQRDRYSRHLLLPEVGDVGQAKLLASKVLLLGAGGLGSPAAFYLAAAGVGTLGLVDADVVDASNLQRQILHRDADIGVLKVDSGERAMRELNPDEMANADIKQAVTKLAPARTKLQLVKATARHLRSVQRQPDRIRKYFEHGPVRYAA